MATDDEPARTLRALIEERARPGADRDAIDRRIWDRFGADRAIVFTDLTGFSRRVAEFGIIHFLHLILEQDRLLRPIIATHGGVVVKLEADSLLATFDDAPEALRCAIDMQRACAAWSEGRPAEEELLLCVGIGAGRVLRVGDVDVFGTEVNAASKLGEDIARSHEILCTGAARARIGDAAGVRFEPLDVAIPGTDRSYRVVYRSERAATARIIRGLPE